MNEFAGRQPASAPSDAVDVQCFYNLPLLNSLWMNTMNRCLTRCARALTHLTLAGIVALACAPAWAQGVLRSFPTSALRGVMQVTTPPLVLLDGQAVRLSPGARIKNTSNLIVMSATLVGQPLLVNYVRDAQGMLHDVWILTPAEAQQKRPGQETLGNIRFESDSQPSAAPLAPSR